MDINRIKKVYMIGIKGVGMTMLAQFYRSKNINVTGSDISEKFMTDAVLKKNKLDVIENFDAKNIPKEADLIVYSSAYNKDNNEEVGAALIGKQKVLNYAEAVSAVFNSYYGIGVVGSHGKTTTTAWLGYVLDRSGLKPNVMVGADVPQFGGNTLINQSDYMIAELDEYQNKLQYINPKAILLNNIDYDHPDFFPTEESYTEVFIDLVKKIPTKGFLVANIDDQVIMKIINNNYKGRAITYGLNSVTANYCAKGIINMDGYQYFKATFNGDNLGTFKIQLIGQHNIYNALAVIATAIELNIDLLDIRKHLANFKGTRRRMQILGEYNKALIIDDYAHHPTEIKSTLAGIKETYPTKNIICVFHPHTFTRTKALINDFAESFHDADTVIILDIYGSAREAHGGVSSDDLIKKIKEHNIKINKKQDLLYIPKLQDCEAHLRKTLTKNNLVILMGAGDIFRIGESLIKK
ncbi:MAG: UDP-N-acetylmuramate--L-alanine ligase [Candidatus Falkowbacteria bacterium]|nr:UDP-N-acetylmuramate--L-alanine ligase [Candidatus Falkowbacteria bacterium]